jgi:lincosamide and streptogramin A transport system ATP-binding/permease protein
MIDEKQQLLKNVEQADTLKIHPVKFAKNRLIDIQNLSINYNGRSIFRDLSFSVDQGDRIALRGKNGSGKSSIIKLLMGEKIDYEGNFRLGSNLAISYVSQDTSFLKGSLKDFVQCSGIDESLFKAILRKLDFARSSFEKDISEFSEGQKKKVLIARSLSQSAHLYIWDEPLNFIDILSRMQIEELILKYQPTMIFVEHDAAFCENVATKTVYLE